MFACIVHSSIATAHFTALLIGTLACLCLGSANAGMLTKDDVQRRFGVPYEVQDKLADVPAWPVTSSLEREAGPVAYVFESIDIAPLPGFEGSPMNFLIVPTSRSKNS